MNIVKFVRHHDSGHRGHDRQVGEEEEEEEDTVKRL